VTRPRLTSGAATKAPGERRGDGEQPEQPLRARIGPRAEPTAATLVRFGGRLARAATAAGCRAAGATSASGAALAPHATFDGERVGLRLGTASVIGSLDDHARAGRR